MRKHLWTAALVLAFALASFSVSWFVLQIPEKDTISISKMSAPEPAKPKSDSHRLININTASAEELEGLSQIGVTRARDIVEFREQNGPFESPEDLMQVKGIGEKTLEKLRDYICLE